VAFSLEKAMASRVVFLGGAEPILRSRALQECVSAATLEDDFDLQVMEASDSSPTEWSAAAGTAPFLSTRRTVIVRHLLRCDAEDISSWKHLPESAFLVLVADEESGDESKLGRIRSQWEKAISGVGGYVEIFKTESKDLLDSIRQEAAKFGKKLSPKGAEALAEMCGSNLSRSLEEVEKLALYVGKAEQISESDVRTVAIPSREWNVFRMIDSATQGDASEALRQLRILVGSATKAEEAAFRNILPMLHRQLKLIWQAKTIQELKANSANISGEVQAILPTNPPWESLHSFVQNKAMKLARSASFQSLAACLEVVSDADAKLKGILPSYSAMDTLDQMLLKLVELLRPSLAATR
jgi:DNA polymerase III delta subunit